MLMALVWIQYTFLAEISTPQGFSLTGYKIRGGSDPRSSSQRVHTSICTYHLQTQSTSSARTTFASTFPQESLLRTSSLSSVLLYHNIYPSPHINPTFQPQWTRPRTWPWKRCSTSLQPVTIPLQTRSPWKNTWNRLSTSMQPVAIPLQAWSL